MHDANGQELKKGDMVLIPAEVSELWATEEYCNVQLTTTLGRRPDGNKEIIGAINTGTVIKVSGGDVKLGI
jgi:hypothetical protein